MAPDIQRYGARGPLSNPPTLGEYIVVTYADHVAAVAAAENLAYERGVKAGYTAREEAVAVVDILRDALAAIDALVQGVDMT